MRAAELVERHGDARQAAHAARGAVPAGAGVEPVVVLQPRGAGELPQRALDGVPAVVGHVVAVHQHARGPGAQQPGHHSLYSV